MACMIDLGIGWGAPDIASATTALAALTVACYQLHATRKHNKISVIPNITTWSHLDHINHNYIYKIVNTGLGPAVIRKFQVSLDGKEISSADGDAMDVVMKILFTHYIHSKTTSSLAHGQIIPANESTILAGIIFNGPSRPTKEEILHAASRVRVIIEYESVYGSKYTLDTESGDQKK